eukprot:6456779-Amphidinium_carterae.1
MANTCSWWHTQKALLLSQTVTYPRFLHFEETRPRSKHLRFSLIRTAQGRGKTEARMGKWLTTCTRSCRQPMVSFHESEACQSLARTENTEQLKVSTSSSLKH